MEPRAILIAGSDLIATAQPCCDHAGEMNYRRGYYDGWRMAIWHLSTVCPEWMCARIERFLETTLYAWKHAGYREGGEHGDLPPGFDAKPHGSRERGIGLRRYSKLRFQILKRDNYRCKLCGASAADGPHIRLHVDHIIARAHGGTNDPENLHTLCEPCNRGKHTESL